MEEMPVEEMLKELDESGKEPDAPEPEKTDPEPDKVEELATKLGWKPKGDFGGENYVGAEDYILKSREIQNTMRDHTKDLKGQLSTLSTTVEELKAHNEKVYKTEVKQLKTELKTLKATRREAIEEGDVDRVEALDEQIDGVKENIDKPKKTQAVDPEYDAWSKENTWYQTDAEMTDYANSIADRNPGVSFKRLSSLVNRKVKEMFPDKFEESTPAKPKPTPSPVEGGGRKTTGTKFSESDLTSNQRATMTQFVKMGIMTKEQYIKDVSKLQGA